MTDLALFDIDAPMAVPPGERPQRASKRMPARVRQADPESSFLAAKSLTTEAVSAIEHAILEVLQASEKALIPQEVAERVQDLHGNRWDEGTVRTRLRPLERRGLVREVGERGQTSRGRTAAKWVAA